MIQGSARTPFEPGVRVTGAKRRIAKPDGMVESNLLMREHPLDEVAVRNGGICDSGGLRTFAGFIKYSDSCGDQS